MADYKKQISKKDYFQAASEVAETMNIKIFVVGGFVRDLILKRKLDDVDILVIGDGLEFAQNLAFKLGVKKVDYFKNYGTAHFFYRDIDLEFVGARKESYSAESRNPVVEIGTFEDDIHRRDFTINSLAISLNKSNFGELIDTFGGLDDIESKIIKTPLNPIETFNDDPLRILRAFRFASQLKT
jgi:tRNA nucleotidyltransferase/poly(A) polymerase